MHLSSLTPQPLYGGLNQDFVLPLKFGGNVLLWIRHIASPPQTGLCHAGFPASPHGSSVPCCFLSPLPCCSSGVCVYRWSRMPRTAQAPATPLIEPSAPLANVPRIASR